MNYNQFMETVYGSLPTDYCLYFYVLSVIGFVLMILAILGGLFSAFRGGRRGGGAFSYNGLFMVVVGYFLLYFQNRLLYTMCVRSLPAPPSRAAAAAATKEAMVINVPTDNRIPITLTNIQPSFKQNHDGSFAVTV